MTASVPTPRTSQTRSDASFSARSAQTRSHSPGRSDRAIGPRIAKTVALRAGGAIELVTAVLRRTHRSACDEFLDASPVEVGMSESRETDNRRRWLALYVLCLGDLMIVLDTTIVNVALPSIRADLGFSETSLAWVVNAYLLTFGGFLLLGGRLGDLYGHRRLFLAGVSLFTIASIACGLSTTRGC